MGARLVKIRRQAAEPERVIHTVVDHTEDMTHALAVTEGRIALASATARTKHAGQPPTPAEEAQRDIGKGGDGKNDQAG